MRIIKLLLTRLYTTPYTLLVLASLLLVYSFYRSIATRIFVQKQNIEFLTMYDIYGLLSPVFFFLHIIAAFILYLFLFENGNFRSFNRNNINNTIRGLSVSYIIIRIIAMYGLDFGAFVIECFFDYTRYVIIAFASATAVLYYCIPTATKFLALRNAINEEDRECLNYLDRQRPQSHETRRLSWCDLVYLVLIYNPEKYPLIHTQTKDIIYNIRSRTYMMIFFSLIILALISIVSALWA